MSPGTDTGQRIDLTEFVETDDRSIQFLPCHDQTPVGFVFLLGIESNRNHAEIGCWLAPDEQGNGYGEYRDTYLFALLAAEWEQD